MNQTFRKSIFEATMDTQTCDCHSLRVLQKQLEKGRMDWKKEAETRARSLEHLRQFYEIKIRGIQEWHERETQKLIQHYEDEIELPPVLQRQGWSGR
jgi:site-specific recombinase XerD